MSNTDTIEPNQAETSEPTETEKQDAWRDTETALVFLEAWGSTSSLDAPLERAEEWYKGNTYKYTLRNYTPEFLDSDQLNDNRPEGTPEVDHDDCITVLGIMVGSDPEPPRGYRLAYAYQCGERQCPACEGSGNHIDHNGEMAIVDGQLECCPLCMGSGNLYWGEEWHVIVFAPIKRAKHWIAGSGQPGCLYDSGPHVCNTKEQAIDTLCETFDGCVGKGTLARMRRDLNADGIHYFDRRIRRFAGASYCEIDSCDCGGSDHPEEE